MQKCALFDTRNFRKRKGRSMQNKIHLQLQGNKNLKIFHQTSVKYDKMLSTCRNFMLGDTKPSQNLQSLQMLNFGIEEEALCLKDHKKQQIETVIGQVCPSVQCFPYCISLLPL